MSFWNEAFYFERRGDRYVYRPTVFSAGFDVSAPEKDELFRGLERLNWRCLLEGGVVIVLAAGAFMAGVIETRDQIQWFLVSSILIVAALAVSFLYRRDRLTSRILGHRAPDVPRLPIRQALARPRPLVGQRYALPVLRSVGILLGLTMVAADALVLYVILAAYRAGQIAEGAEEIAAVERLVSLTLKNPAFWLVVGLFNAVLLAAVVFLIRLLRRLRAAPGNT